MFTAAKGSAGQSNRIDTLIGASTSIIGNLNSSGVVKFDGKLNGDIVSESDVIIGEEAHINGSITAFNVSIAGNVEGNVKSSGTLEILSSGTLIGDVEVANFSIGKGAVFNGKCNMTSDRSKTLAVVNE